jgi:hypothetical protein
MIDFRKISANPTPLLRTTSPVNANTKSIVVRVATILQETVLARLLACVSMKNPLLLKICTLHFLNA